MLLGVSWGSMLGVRIVKTRPVFKAIGYAQLLAEAKRRGDQTAIAELEANGPPPYDSVAKASVHTKWANAYEAGQPSSWQPASIVLFDSESGVGDLRNYIRGIVTSRDHFRDARSSCFRARSTMSHRSLLCASISIA